MAVVFLIGNKVLTEKFAYQLELAPPPPERPPPLELLVELEFVVDEELECLELEFESWPLRLF